MKNYIFQGEEYSKAKLKIKTLPVMFPKNDVEHKIISIVEKTQLNVLSAVSFIDTQYDCFVCLEILLLRDWSAQSE